MAQIQKTRLYYELHEIIGNEIHKAKCAASKPVELTKEQWQALDNIEIAKKIMARLLPTLEAWAFISCCHTTGMLL